MDYGSIFRIRNPEFKPLKMETGIHGVAGRPKGLAVCEFPPAFFFRVGKHEELRAGVAAFSRNFCFATVFLALDFNIISKGTIIF